MKRINQFQRRIFSVLLTIALVFSLLPMQVLAEEIESETTASGTYTVTFKTCDGERTINTMSVENGAVLTSAAINEQVSAPARENYTFMGWSVTQGDVGEMDTVEESFTFTADTTLYAVYSRDQVNIIYMTGSNEDAPGVEIARFRRNSNDHTNQIRLANTIQTVADWQSYVTKDGFRFLGWKSAVAGRPLGNNFITNSIWTGTADLYMYAQYERTSPLVEYTVSLKNYDGSSTLGTITVESGAALTSAAVSEQVSAPARENYTFMGWSVTQGDIGETDTVEESFTFTADTTLYAVYSRDQVNIIYMTSSNEDAPGVEIARFRRNSNDHTNQIRLANTIQTVADWQSYVTKDGFRFLGWKCAEAGKLLGNNFTTNSIWTGTADLYMYAQYEQTAVTYQVSLKNFDGSKLLGTISVVGNTALTVSRIEEVVPTEDTQRASYIFVGWSSVMGDVDESFSAPDEFVITSDTDLYAVYRTLQPKDVDKELLGDLVASVDELEKAVEPIGLSMQTLAQTPEREPEFYAYLEEYLESRYPEEMAQLQDTESPVLFAAESRAVSPSRAGFDHAYDDAVWMMTKRPDVDFGKEIIYQFTAHCIDVPESSVGTFIPCTNNSTTKYLTDLDRRTYDLFYSKASGITIYKNLSSLVGLAASGSVGNTTKVILGDTITSAERYISVANAMSDGADFYLATAGLANTTYSELTTLQYNNKEELFSYFDNLVNTLNESLYPDYGRYSLDYARAAFFAIAGVALGGPVFAAAASMFGVGGSYISAILDRVNYLAMRMYIQTRVTERMMFSWGMSDGRN